MNRRRQRRRHEAGESGEDLPLTSMLDAVFILLIFLMIAVNFQEAALPLDLPGVADAPGAGDDVFATVLVDADERIFVSGGGRKLTPVQAGELRKIAEGWAHRTVRLEADASANFASVVGVFDALRSAGVEKLRIGVRKVSPE